MKEMAKISKTNIKREYNAHVNINFTCHLLKATDIPEIHP